MKQTPDIPLPEIPPKRYFAIGEVSDLCGVKAHVLRYWEAEFPQLKPSKRRGNRRYYQQGDVELIRRIRNLVWEQGYTINAARLRLKDAADDALAQSSPKPMPSPKTNASPVDSGSRPSKPELRSIVNELEALLARL